MEKLYKVQMNSKGMPNFSTAVEVAYIQSEVINGNEHNCIMTIFGECSYAETGCGNCAVVEKVRKALSADRPQGEWIEVDDVLISCRCSVCGWEAHLYEDDVYGMPYCPNCGARMKGADDEKL